MNDIVEAIKEGEIVRMSEAQAREEDLFILRRVSEPAKETDYKVVSTKESVKTVWKEEHGIDPSYSKLQTWKSGKFSYKRNEVIKDLIDNFHWHITRARRAKDMNRKDLADAIGVSEGEIKMIEMGELPKDDFVLISKIENKLGVSLRKEKAPDKVTLADLQKMSEDKARGEIDRFHKPKTPERAGGMGDDGGGNVFGDDIEIME